MTDKTERGWGRAFRQIVGDERFEQIKRMAAESAKRDEEAKLIGGHAEVYRKSGRLPWGLHSQIRARAGETPEKEPPP